MDEKFVWISQVSCLNKKVYSRTWVLWPPLLPSESGRKWQVVINGFFYLLRNILLVLNYNKANLNINVTSVTVVYDHFCLATGVVVKLRFYKKIFVVSIKIVLLLCTNTGSNNHALQGVGDQYDCKQIISYTVPV